MFFFGFLLNFWYCAYDRIYYEASRQRHFQPSTNNGGCCPALKHVIRGMCSWSTILSVIIKTSRPCVHERQVRYSRIAPIPISPTSQAEQRVSIDYVVIDEDDHEADDEKHDGFGDGDVDEDNLRM